VPNFGRAPAVAFLLLQATAELELADADDPVESGEERS
jgi:hypothetical protein